MRASPDGDRIGPSSLQASRPVREEVRDRTAQRGPLNVEILHVLPVLLVATRTLGEITYRSRSARAAEPAARAVR